MHECVRVLGSEAFLCLAADSTANMNEWLSKLNFVAKLRASDGARTGLVEKRAASSRSVSNTSAKNGTFTDKAKATGTGGGFSRFSKSSSAPSSPTLDSGKSSKSGKSDASRDG